MAKRTGSPSISTGFTGQERPRPEMAAGEARPALRNLIELIAAEPRVEGRGLDLLVHGHLAQILHIANDRPD
ncbi:hypothetical protein JW805_14830 [Roseomonas aeriglobus]|nr:hypothetical protein [Roseomonas aeriglobus]